MSSQPDSPSTGELVEGLSFFPIALVVSATIFPGLTICIPGLILGAAFIVVPLLALALVVLLVFAVVAAPIVAVRGIRELVRRRAAKAPSAVPAAFTPPRFAAAAVQRLTADAPLHPQPHRSTTVGR
jgi:hypothetical protein